MFSRTPVFIKTNKLDNIFSNLILYNLVLYIVTSVLTTSSIMGYFQFYVHRAMQFTFAIPFLIFIYFFLRGKWTYVECAIFTIILLIAYIIRINTGQGAQILFMIYTIVCILTNDEKFFFFFFWTLLFSVLFVVVLNLGLKTTAGNVVQTRFGQMRMRYSLGFTYTTIPANYYFSLISISMFVIKKWKSLHYFVLLLVAIILFVLTDTKNAFICSLLTIVLIFIKNYFNDGLILNVISKINMILYIVGAGAMWIFSALFDPKIKFFQILNYIVTGRLELTKKGFSVWKVALFAERPNATTPYGLPMIDSSYMVILFYYGIIMLCIVVGLMTYLSYVSHKKNDKNLVIALFVIGLHSIFDPQLLMIIHTPIAVLALYYIYKYYKIVK